MNADAYAARFRRVLDAIDANLEGDLSVERLSDVAAFSPHHFHRQFSGLFGLGVHRYVQLVRFKRASYQLAYRDDAILDVALACGYESHEAFTRAFKKAVGQTPSAFRAAPSWTQWHGVFRSIRELRRQHMRSDPATKTVDVVEFPETRVAILSHRGDPARIGDTIRAFIAWRKLNHLPPRSNATFNLLYGDPEQTPPDEFRLDLCVATRHPIVDDGSGIVEGVIPAGRCAVVRHVGSDDTLAESLLHLYAAWLPASGEEPRDFPPFLQRVSFFPDVPEHEAITDVFLPLRPRRC